MISFRKLIVIIGIVLVLIGIFWPYLKKLPIGRLPGDIFIQKENFSFYFPITTMIILSILLSIVLRIIKWK